MGKVGDVMIGEQLTIHNCEEITNYLGAALKEKTEIILDASMVNCIDASGLQLLIAGAKEAKIKGKVFVLKSPTEYLNKILDITGANKVISIREED